MIIFYENSCDYNKKSMRIYGIGTKGYMYLFRRDVREIGRDSGGEKTLTQ